MSLLIVIKKWILWPLEGQHKFNSLGIFLFFLNQKMGKKSDNITFIFINRILYKKWYLIIFDTKITIFPCKVRHISPSQDVWIRLAVQYLHIDIFDQNLKNVWILCVSLFYVPCSCKVFSPVLWPPAAARWKRKQEIQSSPPVVALVGDRTADWRIKSGLLRVGKIRKCAGKCHTS